MTENRTCAFQYAKVYSRGFGSRTEIVCDKSELTEDEAIELWNKYYLDCAKHIHSDENNTAEMVIWTDMRDPHSYCNFSHYIDGNAESDGKLIWETKRMYFPAALSQTPAGEKGAGHE